MPPLAHTVVGYLRSLLAHPPVAEASDGELLLRFLADRDGAAFAALVHRHGPRVLGLAERVAGHHQTAEDIFQATFLLLARQARAVRRPEAVGSWLSRTAFRLALRARRSRARRDACEALALPRVSPSLLDELSARELLTILDEEIARLPEACRWPLILCCLDGLSHQETAQLLNCSQRAVRGRLERGRARLGQRLAARGLALPALLAAALLPPRAATAVPPALSETTLRALVSGVPSPAVNTLVKGAIQMMWLGKLKAIGMGLLLLGAVSAGIAFSLQGGLAAPGAEPPAEPKAAAPAAAQVDLYGDPLPQGATMRLGTLKLRAVLARLAVSSDNKSIVSVRGGKYVSVWDAETGKLREKRELPTNPLGAGYLSPDGRWLAIEDHATQDVLAIWDVPAGKRLHTLSIKGARYLMPAAFSPDGKMVAVVGNAGKKYVRVWRLEDGKEVFAKDIDTNVSDGQLTFTPDSQRLLASFGSIIDQGTYCWDLAAGELVWQNKQFSPPEWVLSADGMILSTADGKFRAIDLNTGEPARQERLPPIAWDNHLALTPDGKTLLVSRPEEVLVWDLLAGKERHVLKGAGEEMVIAPDGKTVFTNDGALRRWDLATGKSLWEDTFELGHAGEVRSLVFSADGKRLASASADGSVRLWDMTSGKALGVWRGHEARRPIRVWKYAKAGVMALDLSADGRWLLSAGSEGRVRMIDTTTGKEIQSIELPPHENGETDRHIYHVRFTPDGKQAMAWFGPQGAIVRGGQPMPELTDKLAVWDLPTGKLADLQKVRKVSSSRAITKDAGILIVGGSVVDAATGVKLRNLEGTNPDAWRGTVAFSADGRLVIGECEKLTEKNGVRYSNSDGVKVWETATGKVVAHIKTKSWVAQVGFMADSNFAVTHDLDGIRVWDVRTGRDVLNQEMPEKVRSESTSGTYAGCFAFAPDGKRLATGHPDGTILVWEVKLPEPKREPLSRDEAVSLWDDLKDGDAGKAWRAASRLSGSPDVVLPLLRERLKPVQPAAAERTDPLIRDLDSDDFDRRQDGVQKLKELGPRSEPALRKALEGNPSAEQRKRIEGLLEALASPGRVVPPEELRELRAVASLERITLSDARRMLEELAKGAPGAPLTQEAQRALRRRP